MLIFKKASETASVLSPQKGGWDFSFSYFAFQTWKHINTSFFFFFQQKNLSLVPGYGNETEKNSVCRGEGGEVTDGT